MVTHRSTNHPICSLNRGEWTVSLVLCNLWPYMLCQSWTLIMYRTSSNLGHRTLARLASYVPGPCTNSLTLGLTHSEAAYVRRTHKEDIVASNCCAEFDCPKRRKSSAACSRGLG